MGLGARVLQCPGGPITNTRHIFRKIGIVHAELYNYTLRVMYPESYAKKYLEPYLDYTLTIIY